jgi:glycerophosphoryl diester phosphodiesterase
MRWLSNRPIAHRGLHGPGVPENSLPAFEAAIDEGYPIELDVRLTADGVPVVVHDPHLERLTGTDLDLAELDFDEVRELELVGSSETVPSLEEVLELVGGREPALVEVKNTQRPSRLEPAVARVLDDYEGEFAVQSFNPWTVGWYRRRRPEWPRGQVAGSLDAVPIATYKRQLLKRLIMNWESQPDFVAYELEQLPYWPVTLHRMAGLPLLAWTVKTPKGLDNAREHADNVIFEHVRP